MSCCSPVDEFCAAMERSKQRAQDYERELSVQEADALEGGWEHIKDELAAREKAAAAAPRPDLDLQRRVDDLDPEDPAFRDEADALWTDVQAFASARCLPLPARFAPAPAGAGDPGPSGGLRGVIDAEDAHARRAGPNASALTQRMLRRFAMQRLMQAPAAQSAFHRRLETHNLLLAAAIAPSPPPPQKAPPPPPPASSGAGAPPTPKGGQPPAYPPSQQPTAAPAAPTQGVRPAPASWSPEEEPELVEVETVEVFAVYDDGDLTHAAGAADEDVGSLIDRALPDVDADERADLVVAFRDAGVETRGAAADLAADRSIARESGDALRRGVGARLGLDREESYARLRDRGRFIAIARAARFDPDAA